MAGMTQKELKKSYFHCGPMPGPLSPLIIFYTDFQLPYLLESPPPFIRDLRVGFIWLR